MAYDVELGSPKREDTAEEQKIPETDIKMGNNNTARRADRTPNTNCYILKNCCVVHGEPLHHKRQLMLPTKKAKLHFSAFPRRRKIFFSECRGRLVQMRKLLIIIPTTVLEEEI